MRLPLAIGSVFLSGCYVQGNPFWLGDGPTTSFLTMDACRTEAAASHADGSPKYAGYRCRSMFLFFQVSSEEIRPPK